MSHQLKNHESVPKECIKNTDSDVLNKNNTVPSVDNNDESLIHNNNKTIGLQSLKRMSFSKKAVNKNNIKNVISPSLKFSQSNQKIPFNSPFLSSFQGSSKKQISPKNIESLNCPKVNSNNKPFSPKFSENLSQKLSSFGRKASVDINRKLQDQNVFKQKTCSPIETPKIKKQVIIDSINSKKQKDSLFPLISKHSPFKFFENKSKFSQDSDNLLFSYKSPFAHKMNCFSKIENMFKNDNLIEEGKDSINKFIDMNASLYSKGKDSVLKFKQFQTPIVGLISNNQTPIKANISPMVFSTNPFFKDSANITKKSLPKIPLNEPQINNRKTFPFSQENKINSESAFISSNFNKNQEKLKILQKLNFNEVIVSNTNMETMNKFKNKKIQEILQGMKNKQTNNFGNPFFENESTSSLKNENQQLFDINKSSNNFDIHSYLSYLKQNSNSKLNFKIESNDELKQSNCHNDSNEPNNSFLQFENSKKNLTAKSSIYKKYENSTSIKDYFGSQPIKNNFFGLSNVEPDKIIDKRDYAEFNFNDLMYDNERIEIYLRELNFRNAKKLKTFLYHKNIDDQTLNDDQIDSKKIILRDKTSFVLKKYNFFRKFNPILFDPLKEKSESEFKKSINLDIIKKPRKLSSKNFITDYFEKIENNSTNQLSVINYHHQGVKGNQSLNKIDGLKEKMNFEYQNEKSKLKFYQMLTPKINYNNPLSSQNCEEFRKKSFDLPSFNINNKNLQCNNLEQQNYKFDEKDKEKYSIDKKVFEDFKITPSKLRSYKSINDCQTPNKYTIIEESNDKKIETEKKNFDFQNYEINSQTGLHNLEKILNQNNLKIKKIQNGQKTIKKSKKESNKQKIYSDFLILFGGIKKSKNLDELDHEARNQEELIIKRPDADDVDLTIIKCNCKLTECLKRYCSCFANGNVCGDDCECKGCSNFEGNLKRAKILEKSIQKNNLKDQNQVKNRKIWNKGTTPNIGCKCSSSKCSKKYCECFRKGIFCMESCQCKNCENQPSGSPEL